jgi:hypothetical protein
LCYRLPLKTKSRVPLVGGEPGFGIRWSRRLFGAPHAHGELWVTGVFVLLLVAAMATAVVRPTVIRNVVVTVAAVAPATAAPPAAAPPPPAALVAAASSAAQAPEEAIAKTRPRTSFFIVISLIQTA